MKHQRRDERRNWGKQPEFPIIDADGLIVESNRRRLVERRMMIQLAKPNDPRSSSSDSARLLLCHRERTDLVTGISPRLVAGRGADCDVKINRGFVSREHALFEYRHGAFYIIDQSTNGTYLRWDQGTDLHLVSEETRLTGSGLISMGSPIDTTEENIIRFRCRRS